MKLSHPYTDEFVREFWALVAKTDSCWIWIGARRGMYGAFGFNYSQYQPHRVAWELVNQKPFPKDMVARHRCPNTLCCRPHEGHVVPGTTHDNARDRVKDSMSRPSNTEVQYSVYLSKAEAELIAVAASKTQHRTKPKMSTYIAAAAIAQAEKDSK